MIRTLKKIFSSLEGIPIAVLGLTYKPDTSTLRRSISIEIVQALLKEKALIKTHDPKADRSELAQYKNINFFEDPYEAIKGSKVLLLLTAWKDYKNLNFNKIKHSMAENPIIFDTAKIWSDSELEKLGYKYISIGSGKVKV